MKKLLSILIVILSCYSSKANARDNNEILADFIYNLVDYVNWDKDAAVKLCSYGYDEISESMDKIDVVYDRLSNVKKVIIETDVDFKDLITCNVIYVANNKEKDVSKLINIIKSARILTISNLPNFTNYKGIIEFKLARGKIKVKVNEESLKESGLQISPAVLMVVSPNQNRS